MLMRRLLCSSLILVSLLLFDLVPSLTPPPTALLSYVANVAIAADISTSPESSPSTSLLQNQRQVAIRITGLTYDSSTDSYTLFLSIGSPELVRRLFIKVEEEGGADVFEESVTLSGRQTIQPEFSGASLKPGGKYNLKIIATDWRDELILLPESESGISQGDESILALRSFTHSPPQTESFQFEIRAVNSDFENDQLHIRLEIPELTRDMTYSGFIRNRDGEEIASFGDDERLLTQPLITTELPLQMKQQRAEQEYDVTVTLKIANAPDSQGAEATYEFTITPPPPPGMGQRISAALANNQYITASIVFMMASTLAFYIYRRRKPRVDESFVRPPMDHTRHFSREEVANQLAAAQRPHRTVAPDGVEERSKLSSASDPSRASKNKSSDGWYNSHPRQHRVIFSITQAPENVSLLRETIIHFPCLIGRKNADIDIAGDSLISRHHVKIMINDGRPYLIDLGSRNGTFIGERRLEPNMPFAIDETVTIRLGKHTYCQLTIDY